MPNLSPAFAALRALLQPYGTKLDLKTDSESNYYLDTKHLQKNGKPLFFGAVQLKKGFVSYHLMPVYLEPQLLTALSPELRARLQGKSCFNFKQVEPALFAELAALTEAGFASYRQQGFV